MTMQNDFTPNGLKLEGAWENDRNSEHSLMFKAIIRECFGVADVICGHHLVYQVEEKRADGFVYQVVQEIPAADTLLFDHDVMKHLFPTSWAQVLVALALTPPEHRDEKMKQLLEERV